MPSLMLSVLVRISSTKISGCHLFRVLSSFLFQQFLSSYSPQLWQIHLQDLLSHQFSFHLFHPRHIWRWLVLFPDTPPLLPPPPPPPKKTQQISASRAFHLGALPLLPESERNLFGLTRTRRYVSSDCVFQCISPTSPSCNEAYRAIAS